MTKKKTTPEGAQGLKQEPPVFPKRVKGQPHPKGKASVKWDTDPTILFRLEQVSSMMLQGATERQVAEAMGYAPVTAHRDFLRVKELWRRANIQIVGGQRDESVAELRYVQEQAWNQWRAAGKEAEGAKKKKGDKRPEWLRIVMEAERAIIGLQGSRMPEEHIVHTRTDKKIDYMTADETRDEIARKMEQLRQLGVGDDDEETA